MEPVQWPSLAAILSGPPALIGFRLNNNLVTPSKENSICCIFGKGTPERAGIV